MYKQFSAKMDGYTETGLTDEDVIGCNEDDSEFVAWVASASVGDTYNLGEDCPTFTRTPDADQLCSGYIVND